MLQKRLLYLADRQQAILAWLERLGGAEIVRTLRSLQSEAATVAWNECTVQSEDITGIAMRAGLRKLPDAAQRTLDEWDGAAQAIVPQRSLRGPIELDSYLARLSPEKRDAWHTRHAPARRNQLAACSIWRCIGPTASARCSTSPICWSLRPGCAMLSIWCSTCGCCASWS